MPILILDHLRQNQVAISVCQSSDFSPIYLKLMSSHSDIATQPTTVDATLVTTSGDTHMEINRDSLGSAAGTYNG